MIEQVKSKEMAYRKYPAAEESFKKKIPPFIEKYTTLLGGGPPKISHYVGFCAMLHMLKSINTLEGLP